MDPARSTRNCSFVYRLPGSSNDDTSALFARRREHLRRSHIKRRGLMHFVLHTDLSSRNDEYSGAPNCPVRPIHDNCGGRSTQFSGAQRDLMSHRLHQLVTISRPTSQRKLMMYAAQRRTRHHQYSPCLMICGSTFLRSAH